MKMLRLLFFSISAVIFAVGFRASAQTTGSSSIPIVTIQATQPLASGPGNPGVFTVFRQGDTNATLNVYCAIGGSASNGVDYAKISNFVTIPGGATSNTIVITPLETTSSSTVAKTVVLQLASSPLLNPVNYEIGVPSNATVYITGPNITNLPPTVKIVSPSNGSIFYTPTNIQLVAQASDPDGTVTNVEFFAGSTDLGPGNPRVLDPPGDNGVTGLVYVYDWNNPLPTNYTLTAVATDNGGASTVSSPVNISVFQGPPPTNSLYSVRIISPPNGAVFFAPVDIPLFAYVTQPIDTNVLKQTFVSFYDDKTNFLGNGQPIPLPTPVAVTNSSGSTTVPYNPTNLFYLVWSNAPVGSHVLTALATVNFLNPPISLLLQSAPVNVTVLATPPPPTNSPPIVNIVATDPVAIAGTNSWVWMGESNSPPTWAAWPSAICQCFTNCGPKTATFTVHRFGDTNDDLTVTYNTGGTASNGVDYLALPGYVTVPAGERSALITIVPIDDVSPAVAKTVILTLTPSANTPPDYIIGVPRRAATIIVNPPGPTPVASTLPDKCFRLSIPGPDGAWFSIESSTDMVNWVPICTNQVVNGSIDFVDPDAPGLQDRYYRVVPVTSTPGD